MASQITSVLFVCSTICWSSDQRKHESSALYGLCEGNPPVTGGFPSQRTSNAENVSMWWRYLTLFDFSESNKTASSRVSVPKLGCSLASIREVKILSLKQNGWHFENDISFPTNFFLRIFQMFFFLDWPVKNNRAVDQIMARRRLSDKPSPEPMKFEFTHTYICPEASICQRFDMYSRRHLVFQTYVINPISRWLSNTASRLWRPLIGFESI